MLHTQTDRAQSKKRRIISTANFAIFRNEFFVFDFLRFSLIFSLKQVMKNIRKVNKTFRHPAQTRNRVFFG